MEWSNTLRTWNGWASLMTTPTEFVMFILWVMTKKNPIVLFCIAIDAADSMPFKFEQNYNYRWYLQKCRTFLPMFWSISDVTKLLLSKKNLYQKICFVTNGISDGKWRDFDCFRDISKEWRFIAQYVLIPGMIFLLLNLYKRWLFGASNDLCVCRWVY